MDVIGLLSLMNSGYEMINSFVPKFDRVYNRALKRWTCNNHLRERFSDNYLSDFKKLINYIKDSSSVNPGVRDFFEILLNEVKADPETASILSAEFSVENYKWLSSIKDEIRLIRQDIKNLTFAKHLGCPEYHDIEDYIPLTVTVDETEDERFRRIFKRREDNKTLVDHIIDGKRRLILFSHPQHGKTTVLAKLAYDLQQSGLYLPLLFNLRNYSPTSSLENQTKLDQRLDNSSSSVLILDGLDELKEDHRDYVVSEISTISENYPLMNIVLSCRFSHKKVANVSGFDAVYLELIKYEHVKAYVHSHCNDPDTFLRSAVESSLLPFLDVPFFLKESIGYFNQYGCLPKDEISIYEHFIDRAFITDSVRKINRAGYIGVRTRLYPYVEQLAFAMMVSQRMDVSIDELAISVNNDETIVERLIGLSLITQSENGDLTFIHNSFKEFILAKKLSTLPSDKIKALVCYPETEILIPTLRNVVVLLIRILSDKSNWQVSDFKEWFICKHPDVLVEVGPECLDAKIRESVFEDIFNDHKRKGVHIDFWGSRKLMQFSSTSSSVLFILKELEEMTSWDVNCMNALKLAEYADFSLISDKDCSRAKDIFLSMLRLDNLSIKDYGYVTLPFINKSIISSDFLEQTLSVVGDTQNCYLIKMVCSMAISLSLSDNYASWVLTKAKFVHDYYENGLNHIISDHELLEFVRSLRNPEHVLNFLDYFLSDKKYSEETLFANERTELIPDLLNVLKLYRSDSLVRRLISIIDNCDFDKISLKVNTALRLYFETVTDVNALFGQRLQNIIEYMHTDSPDYFVQERLHNLLSILLTKDNVAHLMERDVEGNFDIYNVVCRLCEYSSRTEEELSVFSDYKNLKYPCVSYEGRIQKEFDILFDQGDFKEEILRIFDGKTHVDFSQDELRWWRGLYNPSVIWFLRQSVDDNDVVSIDDVMHLFNDREKFLVYRINRLLHYFSDKVKVSDTQRNEIEKAVISLLPVCNSYINLAYCLIQIVVYYQVELTEVEFQILFPWSGFNIQERQLYNGISYGNRKFIDYIYDHIQDKSLLEKWIRSAILKEFSVSDSFYETSARFIITHRVVGLYKCFRELLLMFKYDYEKLNIAVELLGLGEDGYLISQTLLDLLSEEDKLSYYEHLLLCENKDLNLLSDMTAQSIQYIEDNYNDYSEQIKQRALKILFAYGRESALKWGLDMLDNCDGWIYADPFPSISGFSGRHFDDLARYFIRATKGKRDSYPRPRPMYESVSSALKDIAMESPMMLEKVKSLFRDVAKCNADFSYYNKVADELNVDYYSRHVTPPDFHRAFESYQRICNG